ncbi:MAG: hypothetical protein SFU99_07055 [Saprospiraceae bacterium]|nr:hypothetical protein [Saprospiraceae bacterium]
MILSDLKVSGREVRVLDPFMGSGTTAIEAALQSYIPYGLDVDPYAKLISDLSVHAFKQKEIEAIEKIGLKIIDKFDTVRINSKLAPDMQGIDYWFSPQNYNDLLKIKTLIYIYASDHKHVLRFFLAVLADIVRSSSRAERQSLKPYISKKFIKKSIPVLPSFEKAFRSYHAASMGASSHMKASCIHWLAGDATNFTSPKKMDVAITSPPYINAMDYIRCIKLESAWIGTGNDKVFSQLRTKQLGETARAHKEKKIDDGVKKLATPYISHLTKTDPQRFKVALAYFQDMHDNLVCVKRALKDDAYYHLIIGNSTIRGKAVPTHKIVAEIAEHVGYKWDKYVRYPIKDHRTSLPRNGRGGKIAEEHVVSLRKS